ncbi:hypothetical protein C0993_006784, partial [Termitomyces sp. T159_Od127]
CILEGGGMAGKLIKDLKKAQLAFYDNKWKEQEKKGSTALKVMFTPAGGNMFMLEGNPATIAVYLATQMSRASVGQTMDFAGLSSNALLVAGLFADMESLEFDAWIVLEPDYNQGHKATTILSKDHKTVLSC